MNDRLESTVDQVFIGRVRLMLPEGEATGIFKAPAGGPLRLTSTGLEGDEQADLRHHGGVDKALHHYPVEHYAVLAAEWPQCAAAVGVLTMPLRSPSIDSRRTLPTKTSSTLFCMSAIPFATPARERAPAA